MDYHDKKNEKRKSYEDGKSYIMDDFSSEDLEDSKLEESLDIFNKDISY